MYNSFNAALSSQNIDGHISFLNSVTDYHFISKTNENLKLKDLVDPEANAWVECKTDKSEYFNRLLIEYKANVPQELLEGILQRRELDHSVYAETFNNLPSKYDALATDIVNLEPTHYLSYWFEKTDRYYFLGLRDLRNQIDASSYPFFVCGHWGEPWKTVSVLVPLSEVRILATQGGV